MKNLHDESTFRLMRAGADNGLWRFDERVDEQVVRVAVAYDWRTALDRYDQTVRTGETGLET